MPGTVPLDGPGRPVGPRGTAGVRHGTGRGLTGTPLGVPVAGPRPWGTGTDTGCGPGLSLIHI
ncbi:hypothetical protein [Streptomyces fragilis]|uniref:hypothetical protein n=1 Tax=Streptomyces fragilis TaxID=67301 RepID=UPI0024DED7EE|nr:hypothetical protein [Streptomyces fragilis]